MKILFTGASSFSGMWFVMELAAAGHDVTATFTKSLDEYTGIRRQRIDQILPICKCLFQTSFGDEAFLEAIRSQAHWDVLCHHAADVNNYKSSNFNVAAALANNTHQIKTVLETLKENGCERIVLTGSVFEQNEGAGSDQLRAVSPYGLSKGLTSDVFSFYTTILKMGLDKFVIPNPFGPYEEGRFTTYLIQSWLAGKTPSVNTPLYVRDNVPVSLLAKAYASFVDRSSQSSAFHKINPSYYVESQGSFTRRFSEEMRSRCELPCAFELKQQVDFNEPLVRINTDRIDVKALHWDETLFWDELADYYKSVYLYCQSV